jgi:ATP diphosphatase
VIMAQANQKFEQRFAKMEQRLLGKQLSLEEASLEEMEAEWQAAKVAERR